MTHKFLVPYQMHNYKTPIKPTQQSITLHNTQLLKVETTQKLKVCACLSLTNHNPFCLLITLTLAFQLIVFFSYFASARTPTNAAPQPQDLVRSSCEHASYPNICIRTLSSYTGPAKTPKDLAQAAVKVSLSRAKRVSNYLAQVSEAKDLKISKRQRGALSDCVEQISESVEELRQTLSELKHLRVETFRWQMSNAETWASAALTYEDTCLDGFQGVDGKKLKSDVKRKIRNVGKVTSNALYMINRLDESRGKAYLA